MPEMIFVLHSGIFLDMLSTINKTTLNHAPLTLKGEIHFKQVL